jgi:spore photoproduct lyase
MRPAVLLLTEHRGELQPFIETFSPSPQGKGFRLSTGEGDVLFYCNRGRGGLEMTHLLYALSRDNPFQIVINAGFCGAIEPGLVPGRVFTVSGGVMADLHREKVLQPLIEAPLHRAESRRLITLPSLQPGLFEKAYAWGSLVDLEGYYLLSWGKANGVPLLLYKMTSDDNREIPETSSMDPGPLAAALQEDLDNIMGLAADSLLLEAVLRLGLPLERSSEACKWADKSRKERLSFTRRHELYRSVKLDRDKKPGPPQQDEPHKFLFMETELQNKESFINAFPGHQPFSIDHYLDYFQTSENEGTSAIYIARKKGEMIRPKGAHYGRPGWRHYSAFNGYNCPMDCLYCFLQGYFKNASPVLFVNRGELLNEMRKKASQEAGPVLFHFGDFCDGAAYDAITGNIAWFSREIRNQETIFCEFRTKSVALGHLTGESAHEQLIMGFSLAPQKAVEQWERRTPSLERRLETAAKLADRGFRLSFHLDPLIIQSEDDWRDYEELAMTLRDRWSEKGLFSVSMGTLRMKRDTYRAIRDRGRGTVLRGLVHEGGFYRYPEEVRREADVRVGRILEEGFGGCYYVCMD